MTGPQQSSVDVIFPDGKRIQIFGASTTEIRLARLSAADGRSDYAPSSTEMLAVLGEGPQGQPYVLAEFRLDRIAGYTLNIPQR